MAINKPSIKKNYIYILAFRVLTLITPLITAPYISRVLGVENIGIFSFTNANAGYFVLFGVFGLASYSQYECAKRRDDIDDFSQFCVESIVTRCILMGLSICVYSCIFILLSNEYKEYYAILLILLFSCIIDFTWICEGLEQYKAITIRNTVVKLLSIACIFIFVKDNSDLDNYFFITVLSSLVGNAVLLPYIKQYVNLKNISNIQVMPHLKGALVFFLPSIASTILYTSDKVMIGWFTNDMAQNGCYEQAVKIEMMIFMIFASLYVSMRARMAYLYNSKSDEAKYYIHKALSVILFLAIPICVGLIQVADVFVPWFFGSGYDGVIILLKIMAGWIIIKAFSNCILELAIFYAGDMTGATRIVWIGTIFNLILNLLLIPRFGALGAAVTSLVSEVVILILVIRTAKSKIAFNQLKKNFIKEFVAVVVMYGIMALIKKYDFENTVLLFLLIIAGAMSYIILVVILKVSVLDEVMNMVRRKVAGNNG